MIWKRNDKTATKGKTSIFSVNEELHINGVSMILKRKIQTFNGLKVSN